MKRSSRPRHGCGCRRSVMRTRSSWTCPSSLSRNPLAVSGLVSAPPSTLASPFALFNGSAATRAHDQSVSDLWMHPALLKQIYPSAGWIIRSINPGNLEDIPSQPLTRKIVLRHDDRWQLSKVAHHDGIARCGAGRNPNGGDILWPSHAPSAALSAHSSFQRACRKISSSSGHCPSSIGKDTTYSLFSITTPSRSSGRCLALWTAGISRN